MHLYAPPSPKLARQIVLDVLVVAWCIGWWFLGRAIDGVIRGIGDYARGAERTVLDLQQRAGSAAEAAGRVPIAGSSLRTPIDDIADTLAGLAASTRDLSVQLDLTATQAGAAGFLIPMLLVVPFWVWHRVRFWRDSAALSTLSPSAARELLALRALTGQPVRRLAAISPDIADGWRRGDPAVVRRLAALETRQSGLVHRAPRKP